jgi:hypothetical protein
LSLVVTSLTSIGMNLFCALVCLTWNKNQSSFRIKVRNLLTLNPWIVWTQCLVNWIHLVYVLCTLQSGAPWMQYQEFVVRVANSGSGTLCLIIGISQQAANLDRDTGFGQNYHLDEEAFQLSYEEETLERIKQEEKRKASLATVWIVSFLQLLPWLFTHTLISAVLYVWIFLPFLGFVYFFHRLVTTIAEREQSWKAKVTITLWRIMSTVLLIVLIQALTTDSVLLYQGKTYLNVLTSECALRNTRCYMESLVEKKQKLSLLTYLM